MDKTPEEIEAIYAEFEALGPDQVRIMLEVKKYYGEASGKKALAKLWLEQKDLEIPWYESWWAGLIFAVLVIVSGGGALYYFGLV